MHLYYYLDAAGKRVYTLKKTAPDGKATKSAHPGTNAFDYFLYFSRWVRHGISLLFYGALVAGRYALSTKKNYFCALHPVCSVTHQPCVDSQPFLHPCAHGHPSHQIYLANKQHAFHLMTNFRGIVSR